MARPAPRSAGLLEAATPDASRASLTLALPGVVSWARPRRLRGITRYPQGYARDRAAWAAVVAHAVRAAVPAWCPPPQARYGVAVDVTNGGHRDLDRVVTAVLDALQAGGALSDDCRVDVVQARRFWLRGIAPTTRVLVALTTQRPTKG